MVWPQSDGTVFQIFKSEYRDGRWVHPADVADNISPDMQGCGLAQVAMSNQGSAVIAWRQKDATGVDQIFVSEYR